MSANVFEPILPKVLQTIRAASALAAQDVGFYRSVDAELAEQIDALAALVLETAKGLINGVNEESLKLKLSLEDVKSEVTWNAVANVLDNVFEKIDIEFDNARRGKSAASSVSVVTNLEDGLEDTDGKTPKRISKPQADFKTPVDNSETHPFKPLLTLKPHALIPLEECLQLEKPQQDETTEEIDPEFYPQPYTHEISVQPYPETILEKTEPIPSRDWAETQATYVDSVSALNEMVEKLKGASEIAVDLEHHDYRTFYGLVCLMQISTREEDWIVDTLVLRDNLQVLNEVFADPNIVKVFHGAFMDIIWLQRDLGLYVVSLFDTYHASKKLGFPRFSLAYLLETYANFKTSKKYQLADWRVRPLPTPMMAYARSDTHFLLNIFDQLRNQLISKGQDKLQEVLYDSRQVAKRRFEYSSHAPFSDAGRRGVAASGSREPFLFLMTQYNVPVQRRPLVEALFKWRDGHARKDDESPRYVMANQVLVGLSSLNQPVTAAKITSVPGHLSEYVRTNARELAELLETTLKAMEERDADNLKIQTETTNSGTGEFDELEKSLNTGTLKKIALATEAFQELEKIQKHAIPEILLSSTSKFMPEVDSIFAVEYDLNKSSTITHDVKSIYKDRRAFALQKFETREKQQKLSLLERAKPTEHTDESEQHKDDEEEEAVKEEQPEVHDNNEVVTLRQKKVSAQKKKRMEEAPQPAFDYANADKIMVETSKRNFKDNKSKKRSFDPYSKDSKGPQQAKKQKKLHAGKTSTFSKKR